MNRVLLRTLVALLTFVVGVCASVVRLHIAQTKITDRTTALEIPPVNSEPIHEEGKEILFRNYEVVKRYEKVNIELGEEKTIEAEVSFAELRQNAKAIAVFDSVYHPLGNETEFGLFDLLGKGESQLVVEQEAWRSGRQWIYDLSGSKARLIFDSSDWGADGGGFRTVESSVDNGKLVLNHITDFYELQDKFAMCFIPMPQVAFAYDKHRQRFLPANNRFPVPYKSKNNSAISDEMEAQAGVVRELLDFVFAGRREKGWQLYERNYRGADKTFLKNRLQAILKQQPVYKFMYEGVMP